MSDFIRLMFVKTAHAAPVLEIMIGVDQDMTGIVDGSDKLIARPVAALRMPRLPCQFEADAPQKCDG
jgi:hypothetical protein